MENGNQLALRLQPRQKRFTPKVKTGCTTCKIRRVKCDEGKPQCRRCLTTGRKCDGYEIIKPLVFEFCSDPVEKWNFNYYRERTASYIVTFDIYAFWERLILQASYSQEAIRLQLCAIGAYHESLVAEDPERRKIQSQLAVKHYSAAIHRLRNFAPNTAIEDVLLTCILFTFFENIQGHMANALQHLNAGLRILSEWRASTRPTTGFSMVRKSALMEDTVAPVLDHLHTIASTLIPLIPQSPQTGPINIPAAFTSLEQAHFYFYQIINTVCEGLKDEEKVFPPLSKFNAETPRTEHVLEEWYASFNAFLSNASTLQTCACRWPRENSHFIIGSSNLQLEYLSSYIRLACRPYSSETLFDAYLNEFKAIIHHWKIVFETRKRSPDSMKDISSCIGFQPTFLPILSFVACRCRDPVIRREAIGLLRMKRQREGVWDSFIAADIVERIVQLEEAAAFTKPVTSCTDIPESARLRMLSCTFFKQNPKSMIMKASYDFWEPDCVRLRMARSGVPQDDASSFETCWLELRHMTPQNQPIKFPEDTNSLYPQVGDEKATALWHIFGTDEAVKYLGHASMNQILSPMPDENNALPNFPAYRDFSIYKTPAAHYPKA